MHTQSVELRQIRYAEAVARLGSFTRAAHEVRVAQPSVSHQVRALERELGLPLFERNTRSVRVTPHGRQFLDAARPALEALDAARGQIREAASYAGETVTLGVTRALGGIDLVEVLTRFRAEYPHVAVRLRTGMIADLVADLDAGALDLVVGPIYPQQLPASVRAEAVRSDELVLVVAPVRVTRVRNLADAAGQGFVCLPAGTGLRRLLDRAADIAGIQARVTLEVGTPEDIRALVAADLGVAVLARSVATGPGPQVVVLDLADPPPYPAVGLITRRRPAPTGPARSLARIIAEEQ